jgi:hypothetical protein
MKHVIRLFVLPFLSFFLVACVVNQTNKYCSPEKNNRIEGKSVQSLEGTHIYVNPVTGEDSRAGNQPGSAKKTIQAAWDSLPAIVNANVTIHLADGVYRQSANLIGKMVLNDKTITISGNTRNPESVRITGVDAGSEVPVRTKGFCVTRQTRLECEGIRFDSFDAQPKPGGVAIRAEHGAEITVRDCIFAMNGVGLDVLDGSHYSLVNSQFLGEAILDNSYGVFTGTSGGSITNCLFRNLRVGVNITHQSNCVIEKTTIVGCGNGCAVSYLSDASFKTGNTISNSWTGVGCSFNAITQFATNSKQVKYENNQRDMLATQGGVFCD